MKPMNKSINGFVPILAEDEVNVIRHQTIGQDGHFVLFQILTKSFEVPLVILSIIKYSLFIMATIIDVIETSSHKNRRSR